MDLDYQQKYTDIRIGKLSFEQFMAFVNDIYNLGHRNGSLAAQSELLSRVNAQLVASSSAPEGLAVARKNPVSSEQ